MATRPNDFEGLDEGGAFGQGWAFFKCCGDSPEPSGDCDLREWMRGFCAAMAEYDQGEHGAVELALRDLGIGADLLAACLDAAGEARAGGEWCRWPPVPIRADLAGQPDTGRILIA